jgi:hypothetical protein
VPPAEASQSHKLSELAFSSSIMVARAKTDELDVPPGVASEQLRERPFAFRAGSEFTYHNRRSNVQERQQKNHCVYPCPSKIAGGSTCARRNVPRSAPVSAS